jgi:hypothetical protein
MYHFEFYEKIADETGRALPVLSGVNGGAWAGGMPRFDARDPQDLRQLGFAHGMCADRRQAHVGGGAAAREAFWEDCRELVTDPQLQVVVHGRLKTGLLSYLLAVPRAVGFRPWTPFHDLDVAMTITLLPPESRRDRAWLRRFFRRHKVDLESMNLPASGQNTLDLQAMRRIPLQPLNVGLLRELFRSSYVEWINRQVAQVNNRWDRFWSVINRRSVRRGARAFGIVDRRLEAYGAYLTLLPLQCLLERRDAARALGRS